MKKRPMTAVITRKNIAKDFEKNDSIKTVKKVY